MGWMPFLKRTNHFKRMKRFLLSFVVLILLIGNTPAQNTTELGIDLIIPIVMASGHQAKTTGFEVFYKENQPRMDTRFKFFVQSNFDEFEAFRRSIVDSMTLYNYYVPGISIGTNLGVAKIIRVKGHNLYYGTDFHFSVQQGDVIVSDQLLDGRDPRPLKSIREYAAIDYAVGVIPFLGTKIKLSEHIHFTLEFGPLLQYRFGKRSFLNSQGQNDQYALKQIELFAGRWLNDIAVSYRF